jgi:hypothetical protein
VRVELARLNDVLSNELAAGSRTGGVPTQRPAQASAPNAGNGNHRRNPNAKGQEPVGAGR